MEWQYLIDQQILILSPLSVLIYSCIKVEVQVNTGTLYLPGIHLTHNEFDEMNTIVLGNVHKQLGKCSLQFHIFRHST